MGWRRLSESPFNLERLRRGVKLVLPVFAAKGLGNLLTVVNLVLLAWVMGDREYGVFVEIQSVALILAMFQSFGLRIALVRFVARYVSLGKHGLLLGLVGWTRRWSLLSSFVALPVFFVVLLLLRGIDLQGWEWIILLLVPLVNYSGLDAALLLGFNRPLLSACIDHLLAPLGVFLVALLLHVRERNLTLGGACLLFVAAFVVQSVVAAAWVWRARAGVPAEGRRQAMPRVWLRTAAPMLFNTAAAILMNRVDTIMIAELVDKTTAGWYNAGAQLKAVVAFSLLTINTILAPRLSALHARKKHAELQRLLTYAFLLNIGIAVLLLVPFFLGSSHVLGIFGPDFRQASTAFRILLLCQFVNTFFGPGGWLLSMTGRQMASAVIIGGALGLNILLNYLLIPPFGMVGAAVATGTSIIVWKVSIYIYGVRSLGLHTVPLHLLIRRRPEG